VSLRGYSVPFSRRSVCSFPFEKHQELIEYGHLRVCRQGGPKLTKSPIVRLRQAACTAVLLFCIATCGVAQTFKTLASFNGANGMSPGYGALVQGLDGSFYGTTEQVAVIFKITPGGTLTKLADLGGGTPYAGLELATDGDLYGTTSTTVFRTTSKGTQTTVHTFEFRQGNAPFGGLLQLGNGTLYGTAYSGGENGNAGTVYAVTPGGSFDRLYSFCSQPNCTDGANPFAVLIKGTDGNLYGTTFNGGTATSGCGGSGCGTVFKINASSKALTTLYSFCSQANCTDGANPDAGLVQASDGNFYGTTFQGGGSNLGTIFRIAPDGTLTTLYSFCSQTKCPDGANPTAALVQATDGNLYGTTRGAGAEHFGTIFKITLGGSFSALHSFEPADGGNPLAGLLQATNGNLYGTTYSEGANGVGTVYEFSVGLKPFAQALPDSGKVGATVKILGYKLKGSTAVSFNGTPALFTVVSNTEIKVAVPSGATTGFVTVTTPSGTLKSNKKFQVLH
jgi:uncharacterized repeat protein (TIGR03803 family)